MANSFKLGNVLRLVSLASDPSSPANGDMYYNTTSNVIRQYVNGAFTDVSAGTFSLTGQSLLDGKILIGNGSNLSAAVTPTGDVTISNAGVTAISAGVIVNADVNASAAIAYSKLALSNSVVNADINASAAVDYTKLALNNSIVNADIFAGAGITYGKLSLANGIVNADINSSAAIAYDKLADLGAATDRILIAAASDKVSAHATILSSDLILKDGTIAYEADQSMNSYKLTNLATPTAANDAANKQYVDNVAEGLKPKTAVRVATTVAGTLASSFENGDTIDGITLATGDRILIKDQASASQNGIYTVNASGAPTRSTDFDSVTPIDEINGAMVAVQQGTANAGKIYVQTGVVATVGTDPINFVFFNSVSGLTGGDGITISGSNVEVDHDGQGLQFSSNQLALEIDGGTLSKSGTGLKVADGGILDAQIGASADIDVSKLSNGSITNTEFNYLTGLNSNIQATHTNLYTFVDSANDVVWDSFAGAQTQTDQNVNGLGFSNANVRSFKALVSVEVDATADLFEGFELHAIQKGSSWDMSVTSVGDSSLVTFSITTGGQVQYSSGTYAGFSSMAIKFRAIAIKKA